MSYIFTARGITVFKIFIRGGISECRKFKFDGDSSVEPLNAIYPTIHFPKLTF